MSDDTFQIDSLDIVMAVVGGVVGFSVLILADLWRFEEFVMIGAVLVGVSAKRALIPTTPRRTDSSALLRMLFLLLAIAGAAMATLSFVFAFTDTTFMGNPSLTGFFNIAQWPLLMGVGALGLAFAIERAFLE